MINFFSYSGQKPFSGHKRLPPPRLEPGKGENTECTYLKLRQVVCLVSNSTYHQVDQYEMVNVFCSKVYAASYRKWDPFDGMMNKKSEAYDSKVKGKSCGLKNVNKNINLGKKW
jgi:hypothetical protein